ncbi:MAG: hypothetical protein ACOYXR_04370 [Nitrospirota bacterium]
MASLPVQRVLNRLPHAKPSGDGWTAPCPAHNDRSPSLSIRAGERGVLLHCFTGCSLDAICAALGLTPHELFDHPSPRSTRRVPDPRPFTPREFLRAAEYGLWRGAIARELRGLAVLDRARGLDVSGWSAADVDRAMRAVCRGYDDLRIAEHLHRLTFAFREHRLSTRDHVRRH